VANGDWAAVTAQPLTCERVRETLRRLDHAIGRVERHAAMLDATAFRDYMALRQRRLALRLLLVARRVELGKQIVDFERWRHGYRAAARPDAASSR
jgi:hypothetical protein